MAIVLKFINKKMQEQWEILFVLHCFYKFLYTLLPRGVFILYLKDDCLY